MPPPVSPPLFPEKTTVEVPALNVKLVDDKKLILPPFPVIVTVLEPKFTVLVFEFEEAKEPTIVTLKLPVSKVPFVTAIPAPVAFMVMALPRVQPPPTPLKLITVRPPMVTPLVVTVFPVVVALNVIEEVEDQVPPASKVKEPLTVNDGVVPVANVTVPAETVKSRQVKAPVRVTV